MLYASKLRFWQLSMIFMQNCVALAEVAGNFFGERGKIKKQRHLLFYWIEKNVRIRGLYNFAQIFPRFPKS